MTDVKTVAPMSEENVKVDETTKEVKEVLPEDDTSVTTEPTPKAGDKTEPNKLLKSLKDEREKRRKLEEEIEQLKSSVSSDDEDDYGDDDSRELKKTLTETTERLSKLEKEQVVSKVLADNPLLRDLEPEFEAFLDEDENKGFPISRLAKLFIAENGLDEKPREGLEKPTGGDKAPISSGMTADEVANLRETNYKQYRELVKAGKITVK